MSEVSADAAEAQVVFRPTKKRKVYRHRTETADDRQNDAEDQPVASGSAPVPRAEARSDDEAEEGLSVAEALRLRNARKPRLRGVGFKAGGTSEDANTEQALVPADGSAADKAGGDGALEGAITQRFAPQTGLIGELVNKHMEEYIESELARRHAAEAAEAAAQAEKDSHERAAAEDRAGQQAAVLGKIFGKAAKPTPALRGKLHEIDLGEDVRKRNEAMTEKAWRRQRGEAVDEDDDAAKSGKVRLGKDGKPWRSRKRRGSDDIKRDEIVEEFLRENKLDVYDISETPGPSTGADEAEVAGDDRVAEEFRRQFMEAMSQRVRRRRQAAPASRQKREEEAQAILRGPKLGGSRNSRAAMRDILLQQQEQAKKR